MKIAIVVSGGGGAGIRHESYFRFLMPFLEKEGHMISRLYGSSVGALTVAAISWGGVAELSRVWGKISDISDIFSGNYWVRWPFVAGIKNAEPLRKIVDEIYSIPRIPFTVTATELKSKRTHYFDEKDPRIKDWVVASARLPVLTEPYIPEGARVSPGVYREAWADGGMRENLPLKRAIEDGHDRIIALHCFPLEDESRETIELRNPIDSLLAMIDVFLEEREDEDMEVPGGVPILHIAPKRETISMLDFGREKVEFARVESFAQISSMADEIKEFLK